MCLIDLEEAATYRFCKLLPARQGRNLRILLHLGPNFS